MSTTKGKADKAAAVELKPKRVEGHITTLCAIFCIGALGISKLFPHSDSWPVLMTTLQGATSTGTYAFSVNDKFTVFFLIGVLTVLRKLAMEGLFAPLARFFQMEAKETMKFKQQGWVFLYYLTAWCWGFYEYYHSTYWFDTTEMWLGYPHTASMTVSVKLYFLFQMAFWFHMVFVTLVEPWQGDFIVMLLHHFITIAMLCGAYLSGHLRAGHTILVEQDLGDIILPAAKMCNYIGLGSSRFNKAFAAAADGFFALFAVVWIITRHIFLPIIYYSLWHVAPTMLDAGTHTLHVH
jgi:acyl-CoA-dependent ceramide synthase